VRHVILSVMMRVSIVGNSGSGKSTLARALAAALDVPCVELDGIYHQPGWQPLPAEEFRARVDELTAAPGWVVDGNYSAVRELVWQRADTVVWVDPPRRTVMRQIVWRTVRRAAFRKVLWNGNRERWRNMFSRDPNESVIAWAWHRDAVYRARYTAASGDPAWQRLRFVPIRTRADARTLLARAAERG
jgi:adenylate kinase family enzyme